MSQQRAAEMHECGKRRSPGPALWTQSALSMGRSTQGLMAMTATTSGPSAGHQHSVLCSELFSECLTVILDDMGYLDLSLFTHFN